MSWSLCCQDGASLWQSRKRKRASSQKKAKCPFKDQEEETEYFNAAFFLDDEKDEALCDCNDADMITIGEILRDCTAQVDEAFPEFVPEVLEVKTEVCILPCVWGDDSTDTLESSGRQLGKRRRRYTFKSGGTCRRCATDARRRLAADTFKQLQGRRSLGDSTPAEMAKEACDFANVSQLAYDEAEASLKQTGDSLDSMMQEGSTDEGYLKKCREAEEIAAEMIEEFEESVDYIMDAEKACIEAKEMAEKGDEKKTKECLDDAKKAAKNAMKGLESVQKGHEEAKKKHLEAKKIILKIDNEEAKERSSRAIEAKERELEKLMNDIERKMERAKDSGDKEQLESLKKQAELEKRILEIELKRFEDEEHEAQEHAEELANLLLSAEFAKNYEAWMEAYEECLEIVTLWELRNHFSKETGTGCVRKYKVDDDGLATNEDSGLKVEVTFDIKERERDTLQKTCSQDDVEDFDVDDVPCEDCDWVP